MNFQCCPWQHWLPATSRAERRVNKTCHVKPSQMLLETTAPCAKLPSRSRSPAMVVIEDSVSLPPPLRRSSTRRTSHPSARLLVSTPPKRKRCESSVELRMSELALNIQNCRLSHQGFPIGAPLFEYWYHLKVFSQPQRILPRVH